MELHMCFNRKFNLFSYGFVIFTNNFENQGCFSCHKTILQNHLAKYRSYHMDQ